jgi:hypothetical protein
LPRRDLRACQQKEKTPQGKTTHSVLKHGAWGKNKKHINCLPITHLSFFSLLPAARCLLPADLVALCHPLW